MTDIKDLIDTIIQGDCLEVLKTFPDNSIDTIITDPPYNLTSITRPRPDQTENGSYGKQMPQSRLQSRGGFMGKSWDGTGISFSKELWTEVLRVAKPGAILLCFGGTRTFHRLACAIEDAGWIIKDTLMWLYGSGFPKSLNIGKAVDKLQGNEREKLGSYSRSAPATQRKIIDDNGRTCDNRDAETFNKYIEKQSNIPITRGTSDWEDYGTALKPAYEPIIMAMKPLDGTFAENALKWGVAGLNIDGGRIKSSDWQPEKVLKKYTGSNEGNNSVTNNFGVKEIKCTNPGSTLQGRFPANLLLDEVSAEMLDEQSGERKGWTSQKHNKFNPYGGNALQKSKTERIGYYEGYNDTGGASRFFYVAKASKSERDAGCEELEEKETGWGSSNESGKMYNDGSNPSKSRNIHPTVKPLKLMEYLVKLTKMPNPNQVYLDPFAGSGSTLIAVLNNDRHFIGIEKEPDYVEIAKARIKYWSERKDKTLDFGEK